MHFVSSSYFDKMAGHKGNNNKKGLISEVNRITTVLFKGKGRRKTISFPFQRILVWNVLHVKAMIKIILCWMTLKPSLPTCFVCRGAYFPLYFQLPLLLLSKETNQKNYIFRIESSRVFLPRSILNENTKCMLKHLFPWIIVFSKEKKSETGIPSFDHIYLVDEWPLFLAAVQVLLCYFFPVFHLSLSECIFSYLI